MAEISILLRRSFLMTFRSDRAHLIGLIWSIPISVAFSRNHSSLAIFFVGAIARCMWQARLVYDSISFWMLM